MITVGQIGVGVWGQNLLRNFFNLKDCSVKICCDKNKTSLERVNTAYNSRIKITDDYNVLLKDKEIDAIIVATLPATHAHFAIKALKSGKHVFVEKPMALDVSSATEMIKTAKKYKKILMVGHLLLYHPAVNHIKKYINDGTLGDTYYIYSTRVNLGKVRVDENALWSLTVHDISVSNYLFEQTPAEVIAIGDSYIRLGTEDVIFLTLRYKNKLLSHIHASWLDPHKIRKLTVVGSKKMAVLDDMEGSEKIRLYDKGFDRKKNIDIYEDFFTLREGNILIPHIEMQEPLKIECQHFIDCILDNKVPLTDGENGLAVVKVLEAAQRSLTSGGESIKL